MPRNLEFYHTAYSEVECHLKLPIWTDIHTSEITYIDIQCRMPHTILCQIKHIGFEI